jgi:hypothetical protein
VAIYYHIAGITTIQRRLREKDEFYSAKVSVLVRQIGHRPTLYRSYGIRAGFPRTLKKFPWENI